MTKNREANLFPPLDIVGEVYHYIYNNTRGGDAAAELVRKDATFSLHGGVVNCTGSESVVGMLTKSVNCDVVFVYTTESLVYRFRCHTTKGKESSGTHTSAECSVVCV